MNSKTKNIISNIIGLIIVALAGYFYFFEKDMLDFYQYCGVTIFGMAWFLFQVSETKNFIKKLFNKKLSE